jgi:CrcB protein
LTERPRRELAARGWLVILVIAVGGVIGAEARYGVGLLLPPGRDAFPWPTVLVNVTGGFAIGVLMALLGRVERPHPLIRPFFGVGILGGLTTFSTYSNDTYRLLDAGRIPIALAYAALTLVAALAATVAGAWVVGAAAGAS